MNYNIGLVPVSDDTPRGHEAAEPEERPIRTYRVSGTVTISCYTVVEARDEDEARALSEDRPMCTISDADSHGDYPEDVWVHSGELDGTPLILEVTEADHARP